MAGFAPETLEFTPEWVAYYVRNSHLLKYKFRNIPLQQTKVQE